MFLRNIGLSTNYPVLQTVRIQAYYYLHGCDAVYNLLYFHRLRKQTYEITEMFVPPHFRFRVMGPTFMKRGVNIKPLQVSETLYFLLGYNAE
jgi:hypothetical protein